jgi:hypothetical protein
MDTKNEYKTILDRMDNVELELLHTDTEYAMQFLREEGYDVEQELRFAEQHMKKVKFMAHAVSNREKDQHLLEIAFDRLKKTIQENTQLASEVLHSLLHEKSPSVQYRNIEKWTETEIREILVDLDLVNLLEELTKEDSTNDIEG